MFNLFKLASILWDVANSADPDQTPHNHGGVGSGYELVQKIKMGNSIRHVWVNTSNFRDAV